MCHKFIIKQKIYGFNLYSVIGCSCSCRGCLLVVFYEKKGQGSQDVDRTGDTVVSTAPEVSSDMGGEKSEDDTPAEVEDDMLKEDSE